MAKLAQNLYTDKLDSINFEQISTDYHFQHGNNYKISLQSFITSYIECVESQLFSLQDWTNRLMFKIDSTLTKQAMQAKFYERHFDCVSAVLAECLKQDFQTHLTPNVRNWRLFSSFNRVLLQDSTCLPLHASLAPFFPGVTSHGKLTATARIQAIYEFKKEEFLKFTLQSYRDNDQKDASSILDILQKDDLVLRDLGYFSLDVLQEIMQKEAFFVLPYQTGVNIYKEDGTLLDLYKILVINNLDKIDYPVLLGSKQKVPVRLVAMRLSDEAKQKKIADAKNKVSKTTNHSTQYYELLGWAIFITNVPKEIWTIRDIGFAYRVRWRIETIFKAWKSSFKLKQIMNNHKMCEYRCKIQLTIMLIYFSLIFKTVFAFFEIKVNEYFKKRAANNPYQQVRELSLIKLATLIQNVPDFILKAQDWDKIVPLIISAAAYEKRKDRPNFENFTY